jgi:TusA-related sulfurtransferase
MLELNLCGLICPIPVLQTKRYLSNLTSGEIVQILTDDPASLKDLQSFCQKTGNLLIEQNKINQQIITIIKRR